MTLREGLLLARAGEAAHPTAVAAFTRLAAAHGTPLYVYDAEMIREQARALLAAFGPCFPKLRVRYALKANTNVEIVKLILSEGLAPEVVSEGEIRAALVAGAKGSDVLFSSSSKSPSEIDFSLEHDVILNVDNLDELGQVSAAAVRLGATARVSFRINPGVDPDTLHQINTGCSESKFGVHLDGGIARKGYETAKALPNVAIAGIHCHIGSQITATDAYEETARKMFAFVRELKDDLGIRLSFVDLGGGLGIPFRDGEETMSPEDLAKALKPIWEEEIALLGYEPELWIEPGRFLVAQAGLMIARVNSVKTTPVKTFVNVDAGFNTLMRPALYGAKHRVRVVGRTAAPMTLDIAGDVCETGDILAEERLLPKPVAGDLVVFLDAGAYGFAMASEYNARPLPAEVLVDGDEVRVIRRRGTFEELHRGEPGVTAASRP
ncbi:MAG TPA: diaminopimelate decarboxylase [Thermoanaerobaculia bacterium]|nr:diaminopimelate decarboxylase [Thermoanaerobaculia bacterium]